MKFVPAKHTPITAVADILLDAGCSDREAQELLRASMISRALERCHGNICRTAMVLNQHRNTLTRNLKAFGLERAPGDIRRAYSAQPMLPMRKAS